MFKRFKTSTGFAPRSVRNYGNYMRPYGSYGRSYSSRPSYRAYSRPAYQRSTFAKKKFLSKNCSRFIRNKEHYVTVPVVASGQLVYVRNPKSGYIKVLINDEGEKLKERFFPVTKMDALYRYVSKMDQSKYVLIGDASHVASVKAFIDEKKDRGDGLTV